MMSASGVSVVLGAWWIYLSLMIDVIDAGALPLYSPIKLLDYREGPELLVAHCGNGATNASNFAYVEFVPGWFYF